MPLWNGCDGVQKSTVSPSSEELIWEKFPGCVYILGHRTCSWAGCWVNYICLNILMFQRCLVDMVEVYSWKNDGKKTVGDIQDFD